MEKQISENIGKDKKDRRKRMRCKCCRERVNLIYWKAGDKIFFRCPKCLKTFETKLKNDF